MNGLKLREIIVMAAISIVCGAIYFAWIFVGQFVEGIFGPIGPMIRGLLTGVWLLAPLICAYIIRKPGVALVAEMIAAVAEVMVGSIGAGVVLLLGLTQGLGAELIFAMFRYRSYRLPVLMLAGMLGTTANFITIYFLYGYGQYNVMIVAGMFISMLISGALVGGLLSKWIADRLAATGVLNNFALARRNSMK